MSRGAFVLNRRMVLEGPARTPDGAGGYSASWAVRGTLWAMLRPGNGRQVAGAGAALSRLPAEIVLRAAPPGAPSRPVPGDRLREGARVFSIRAVAEEDAAGRYLTCFVDEEIAP